MPDEPGRGGRAELEFRLGLHRAFWDRLPSARPPASFRVGDFFFARHFRAAAPLLAPGTRVEPDMIDVGAFMADYERMFSEAEEIGQDGFWTAEPFLALPWMEAILGCEIVGNGASFATRPRARLAEPDRVGFEPEDPWFRKFAEFSAELARVSEGRFPVGEPIMRGPSDVAGALLGQSEMVLALVDRPDEMRELLRRVTEAFLAVMAEQRRIVPAFRGGSALGFYHVWAPGPAIWFQDDLSVLLSPELYREFFLGAARDICAACEYAAMHLHPASFFVLDDILSLEGLRAVEVNKDEGGPGVREMLPALRKILGKKSLILWGDLTVEDLAVLERELPSAGLFLNIVAPSLDEAKSRNAYIRAWGRKHGDE